MKKASHILFLIILAAVFAAVPILTLAGQGKISYYEQRALTAFPALTTEALSDGSWFSGLDSFLSDHFGGRDSVLRAEARLHLWMGKPVVNEYVVNSDAMLNFHGYLRWSTDSLKPRAAARAEQYKALQECVEAYGGTFCFLAIPCQSTYFAGDYPAYMDDRLWNIGAMQDRFREAFAEAGIPYIDMYEEYRAEGFPREYYYATDHHFTLRGGFKAYEVLTDRLREWTEWDFSENTSPEDFDLYTLPNPFLGSSNRQLFGLWKNADAVEIACVKAAIPFTRTDNGYAVKADVYDVPSDSGSYVNYEVYMGGDVAETVIRTERPDKPNILIYGDSYTNILEALLWTQANELHSLDYRYYTGPRLREYIAAYQPDIVICVRDETLFYSEDGNGIT